MFPAIGCRMELFYRALVCLPPSARVQVVFLRFGGVKACFGLSGCCMDGVTHISSARFVKDTNLFGAT